MGKRIEFGNDIVKMLKKYGYNKIGEVPTKYKNGFTIITYMYSMVSDIDKLKYVTPYIEYTIDEETDGFIDGMCYPEGGADYGVEIKYLDDVKYFIENAKWTKEDLTESKNNKWR